MLTIFIRHIIKSPTPCITIIHACADFKQLFSISARQGMEYNLFIFVRLRPYSHFQTFRLLTGLIRIVGIHVSLVVK